MLFQSWTPHRPGVYPAYYTVLPRVTTLAKSGLKINITRGILSRLNTELTQGYLWGSATGYFSATDLSRGVVFTPD